MRCLGISVGIAAASALLSWRLAMLTGSGNTLGAQPPYLLSAGRDVIILLSGFAAVRRSNLAGAKPVKSRRHPMIRNERDVKVEQRAVAVAFVPSPLAGEGMTVVQHALKGEGDLAKILSKRPPHPFFFVAPPSSLPREGEGKSGTGRCHLCEATVGIATLD